MSVDLFWRRGRFYKKPSLYERLCDALHNTSLWLDGNCGLSGDAKILVGYVIVASIAMLLLVLLETWLAGQAMIGDPHGYIQALKDGDYAYVLVGKLAR